MMQKLRTVKKIDKSIILVGDSNMFLLVIDYQLSIDNYQLLSTQKIS